MVVFVWKSRSNIKEFGLEGCFPNRTSSTCKRNWSTFALIHTKQRNPLANPRLKQLVFCYYNMKLKIRDMEAETDKVSENNFLDLLEISAEFGEEDENQLFQWVRPLHLDDEDENPDP